MTWNGMERKGMECCVLLCCVAFCIVTLCCVVLHVTLCYMLHCVTLCYVVLRCVTLRCVTLCYVALRCVTLRYYALRYFRYVVLLFSITISCYCLMLCYIVSCQVMLCYLMYGRLSTQDNSQALGTMFHEPPESWKLKVRLPNSYAGHILGPISGELM